MDGIVIINKPKGCTSHDIVYKTKKIFNEKVGHTGTLDPNATGVLPLLIGKGTLLSKYLINHDKVYEVGLKLGIKTETADSEGNTIQIHEIPDNATNKTYVNNVLQEFIGKQKQIPPMYSAIKVNGKKLYEYARKGEKIEIEPRDIEIFDITLIDVDAFNNRILFKVSCSKGTYIRSLCEDIAKELGTVGYMDSLNRTKVGEFNISDAINIEQLEANKDNKDFMDKHFITIESFCKDKQSIKLNDKALSKFLNGVKLKYNFDDGIYKIYNSTNQFVGTAIIQNGFLKRDIILI